MQEKMHLRAENQGLGLIEGPKPRTVGPHNSLPDLLRLFCKFLLNFLISKNVPNLQMWQSLRARSSHLFLINQRSLVDLIHSKAFQYPPCPDDTHIHIYSPTFRVNSTSLLGCLSNRDLEH